MAQVCRKAGISQATCFSWRKKHSGLRPDENGRLRKIVVDLTLDRDTLQHVIRRNP